MVYGISDGASSYHCPNLEGTLICPLIFGDSFDTTLLNAISTSKALEFGVERVPSDE